MNAVAMSQKPATRAILNQAISYNKDGAEVIVLQNTEILVDIEFDIALIGTDHVHVTSDEYTLI